MGIKLSAKYLAAVLIGLVYGWVLVAFWGRYAVNNPINNWLLEALAKGGHGTLYYIIITAHDFLVNVLLAVPVAFILAKFTGRNNWNCVFVSVAAANIVGFWGMELSALPLLVRHLVFWVSLAMGVVSLPIAFGVIRSFRTEASLA